ncbi:YXWGXW repeat-containing protein [candidate division KSB1 bacterium]|nr:YXWGXW repeat-containing protein [candidate division KSB1 bacterium]
MKSSNRFFVIVFAFMLFGFTVQSFAARRVYVKKTPPARKVVVVKTVKPHNNSIWVKGHWKWENNRYVWLDGCWENPKPGHLWIDGHWKKTKHGWIWVQGHWKKQ